MSDVIDLLTPAQEAFFDALLAAMPSELADVFVVMPENPPGNFALIGAIDSEDQGEVTEQFEKLTVEVQYIYRGDDRRQLLTMMAAGRAALDRKFLTPVAGVDLSVVRHLHSSASSVAADGKTYAGIQNFTLFAQPA